MPSKKIILIVSRFPVVSETFIVNKFTGLVDLGMNVHLVARKVERKNLHYFPKLREKRYARRYHGSWPAKPSLFAALFFPAAFVHSIALSPKTALRYLFQGLKHLGPGVLKRFYLDARLIALRPDLLHFEFGAQAVGRCYLKAWLGVRLTVSFRGYDLNYAGLDRPDYYEELWEAVDAIHCLGTDLKTRALKRGVGTKPIYLIPPAVDISWFQRTKPYRGAKGKPLSRLQILSVGRLEWKKGYEFALLAVQCLNQKSIPFEYRIVGEGPHYECLQFTIAQLGLQDKVTLLGAMNATEVRSQMSWADVFLHTAVSEGFCNAVMEAQAMELPVVCSDSDGLKENVIDNQTGKVFPRRDFEHTAEALLKMYQDPTGAGSLGSRGRQHVLEDFPLDRQLTQFKFMYDKALSP